MKKKIYIIIGIVALLAISITIVLFNIDKSNNYSYTVEEEKWIEKNKNNVIDIYMPSDISSLTLSGDGLFFDFVNYFTKNNGIKINPVAYQIEDAVESEYSILLVDKKQKNDIEILTDEYVIIAKKNTYYSSLGELNDLKIGVLNDEKDIISKYLGDEVIYSSYTNKELLLNALNNDEVDGIVGLKTLYLNDILVNNYHIVYHISDLTKKYVLRINGTDDLINSIMKKEINKFLEYEYKKAYNTSLFDAYVKALDISEQELTTLDSKKYTYGYIENGIYDNTYHNDLTGKNYYIIKSFAAFANLDMKYNDKYVSLDKLNSALLDKKIDFYFDITNFNGELNNTLVTPVGTQIVLLVNNNSKISINSLESLKDYKISVLKNSKLERWLNDNKIKTKSFDTYNDMLKQKNLTNNTIVIMELENYEYYKTRNLRNYRIEYIVPGYIYYGFYINEENETFIKLFNFYLEYMDLDKLIDRKASDTFEYEGINLILILIIIILVFILICQFLGKIKKLFIFLKSRKNNTLNKSEKLKYIDSLTSLKNRAYLNDNIDKWDNSEIYPQIIIVVDLNNVAYINDNFGHEEGDKVITEAANILILTQLPNTEIIRTDGNEFLIYMVEYEEKKAVAYMRKLNREFKNLSHGYGAAIGYSIINDAIKTIDDAVNEATLDMRTNKEIMMEEEK